MNVHSIEQAFGLVHHHAITAVKIDSSACHDLVALAGLISAAQEHDTGVIIKKLGSETQYRTISQVLRGIQHEVYLQGFLFDQPNASLFAQQPKLSQVDGCRHCF